MLDWKSQVCPTRTQRHEIPLPYITSLHSGSANAKDWQCDTGAPISLRSLRTPALQKAPERTKRQPSAGARSAAIAALATRFVRCSKDIRSATHVAGSNINRKKLNFMLMTTNRWDAPKNKGELAGMRTGW
jgi:hypothetical protein